MLCSLEKQRGYVSNDPPDAGFPNNSRHEKAAPGKKVCCRPAVKSAWAELINEKQLEISCSLCFSAEICDETEITLLRKPRFIDQPKGQEYPMVITVVKPGEDLWELAKRYRTTREQIEAANRLEGEPVPGQKLLIVK